MPRGRRVFFLAVALYALWTRWGRRGPRAPADPRLALQQAYASWAYSRG